MADLREVRILTFTPVKDDAGLSGRVIGKIFGSWQAFECVVDYAQLHDNDVPMTNPRTWKDTGKQGWVEWSHCVEGVQNETEIHILTTVYTDGRPPVSRIVP